MAFCVVFRYGFDGLWSGWSCFMMVFSLIERRGKRERLPEEAQFECFVLKSFLWVLVLTYSFAPNSFGDPHRYYSPLTALVLSKSADSSSSTVGRPSPQIPMLHIPRRILRIILSRMHTRTPSRPTSQSLLTMNPHTLHSRLATTHTPPMEVTVSPRIEAVLTDTLPTETWFHLTCA